MLNIIGSVDLSLNIAGFFTCFTVYVTEYLTEQLLLGTDFIKQNGMVLDYVNGVANNFCNFTAVKLINKKRRQFIAKKKKAI